MKRESEVKRERKLKGVVKEKERGRGEEQGETKIKYKCELNN